MTTMVSLTKITFVVAFYAFSAIFMHTTASRVLELSDRFLEIHKDGQWLVMVNMKEWINKLDVT